MIIMSNMLYILSHARLSNIRVQSVFTWEKWDLGFFFLFSSTYWRIFWYTPITSTIFTLPTTERHNQKVWYSKQNWRNVWVSDLFGWSSWNFCENQIQSALFGILYSFWTQTFWFDFLKLIVLNNFLAIWLKST